MDFEFAWSVAIYFRVEMPGIFHVLPSMSTDLVIKSDTPPTRELVDAIFSFSHKNCRVVLVEMCRVPLPQDMYELIP